MGNNTAPLKVLTESEGSFTLAIAWRWCWHILQIALIELGEAQSAERNSQVARTSLRRASLASTVPGLTNAESLCCHERVAAGTSRRRNWPPSADCPRTAQSAGKPQIHVR